MNEQLRIIDYPPSPRPAFVDSLLMTMQLMARGQARMEPWQARSMAGLWEEWAEQLAIVAPTLPDYGIDYLKIQPGAPMIDCKPGSNRYAIFDEYKPLEYINGILNDYAPKIHIPGQVSGIDYVKGRAGLETPFVFKPLDSNRGENKFLIEDADQEGKLKKFLRSKKQSSLGNTVIEEFIETPGELSSSYRYTMTPTGTIIAIAMLAAGKQNGNAKMSAESVTEEYKALVKPGSPYYLNARSITSNTNEGRRDIGLDFAGRPFELGNLDDQQMEILEGHGINPITREPATEVTEAARNIARTLGPSIGMCIGIDIIQQSGTDTPYFLEANSLPSARSINASMPSGSRELTQRELKLFAMLKTVQDLAS